MPHFFLPKSSLYACVQGANHFVQRWTRGGLGKVPMYAAYKDLTCPLICDAKSHLLKSPSCQLSHRLSFFQKNRNLKSQFYSTKKVKIACRKHVILRVLNTLWPLMAILHVCVKSHQFSNRSSALLK